MRSDGEIRNRIEELLDEIAAIQYSIIVDPLPANYIECEIQERYREIQTLRWALGEVEHVAAG